MESEAHVDVVFLTPGDCLVNILDRIIIKGVNVAIIDDAVIIDRKPHKIEPEFRDPFEIILRVR